MRFTVILFPWQKYNYFQYTRNFATLFIFHHPSTTRTGTRWFPWRLRLPSGAQVHCDINICKNLFQVKNGNHRYIIFRICILYNDSSVLYSEIQ